MNSKLPVPQRISLKDQILLKIYVFLDKKAAGFHQRLMQGLEKLRYMLRAESAQTKEMLQIYIKQTQGQATAEEVQTANRQFQDLIRSLGLGVLLIMPFSPLTLPFVVKLGRKLGVEILPDSARQYDKEKEQSTESDLP